MAQPLAELSKIEKGEIALLLTSSESYPKTVPGTAAALAKKGVKGIYVTVNKPYATLIEKFKKDGIDTGGMFFIDCITKMVGGTTSKPSDNFITIASPQFLTEISIAISQAMAAMGKGERYFIFDSVSNLLIYNNAGTVARFMHFLTGKVRDWGARAVFLGVDKEVDTLLPYITQFVDRSIRVR